MKLFCRRRGAKPLAPSQEKTAHRIAEDLLAIQLRWAAWLNAQALKLGKRNTLFILGALVIGLGLYSS